MARGWESKAIEAQQADAAAARTIGPPRTAEDAHRQSRRAILTLARTRALAELQSACAAPHRAMLERAIAELDRQLAEIEGSGVKSA